MALWPIYGGICLAVGLFLLGTLAVLSFGAGGSILGVGWQVWAVVSLVSTILGGVLLLMGVDRRSSGGG